MSTIIAANISDGTTSVPSTYVVNGSAKAWVNLDVTTGIRDSLNVSSATDNGSGDYTQNFTNSMGNASYSTQASGGSGRASSGTVYWGGFTDVAPTTSSSRIQMLYGAGTAADPQDTCFTTHGDLA